MTDRVDDLSITPIWISPGWDVIGDVHGCFDELIELLGQLGYRRGHRGAGWGHPEHRTLIFLGDLTDRGPNSIGVIRLTITLQRDGAAYFCMGNHDNKLMRAIKGNPIQARHGLAETLEELSHVEDKAEMGRILQFLSTMAAYFVVGAGTVVGGKGWDHGDAPRTKLVVAHAGIDRDQIGAPDNKKLLARCIYGNLLDERDKHDFLIRDHSWTEGYDDDEFFCVYGHTYVSEPNWRANTVNIDTGPAYGGSLTAFRWPERELVAVAAPRAYAARVT